MSPRPTLIRDVIIWCMNCQSHTHLVGILEPVGEDNYSVAVTGEDEVWYQLWPRNHVGPFFLVL